MKKSRYTFDRKKLQNHFGKVQTTVLEWFGRDVRRAAKKRLLKPTQARKTSKPGESPVSRTGTLKNLIFYELDPVRGVVIGPVQFKGQSKGAKALEYGGRTTVKDKGKKKPVTIEARPFMQPAFEKVKETLPDKWRRAREKFANGR